MDKCFSKWKWVVSILSVAILMSLGINGFAKERIRLVMTAEDISPIVEKFNASQDAYEVVVENVEWRNWRHYANRLKIEQKAAENDKTPAMDIALVDNNWLEMMIRDGQMEGLRGKIDRMADFIPGLRQAAEKDGQVYAVPFQNKGLVLFYRKDWHEKYNLPIPRSLKALEKNALSLLEKQSLDHGVTIHYSAIHLDLLPFVWSNGGAVVDHGETVLDSPSNIETFELLAALSKERVLPPAASFEFLKEGYRNALKCFVDGRSAYLITWNNRIQDLDQTLLKGRFGVLPIPSVHEGGTSYSVIGSWYFAVNSHSKAKTGALRFLNSYFTDEAQHIMMQHQKGFLPALASLYDDPALRHYNPYLGQLKPAMANMRHRLRHINEYRIHTIFQNSIYAMLIRGIMPQKALQTAQVRIQAEVE